MKQSILKMNETELSVKTIEESMRVNCQEILKIPSFTLSLGFTIPLPAPDENERRRRYSLSLYLQSSKEKKKVKIE